MLRLMKMQKENINITPYLQQAETQARQILPRSVSSALPLCAPQAPVSPFPCAASNACYEKIGYILRGKLCSIG